MRSFKQFIRENIDGVKNGIWCTSPPENPLEYNATDLRTILDFNNYEEDHLYNDVEFAFYKKLNTLEGCPEKVINYFYLNFLPELKTLEYAPKFVGNSAYLSSLDLSTLSGIGKRFFNEIKVMLSFDNCTIDSSILGLLLIKGLSSCVSVFNGGKDLERAIIVINNHLPDRDILEAKTELIELGYSRYAKL
jgi:hypothetical protein